MSYAEREYARPYSTVSESGASERVEFIRKTYLHLLGAILAFVGIEVIIFNTIDVEAVVGSMMAGRFSWLIVLGVFMVVSWIANSWAQSDTSKGMQYAGLGLYVLAQALIFVPLLYVAQLPGVGGPNVLPTAAMITIALFGALTAVPFVTGKDFSFLGGFLMLAGFVAMGVIVCGILFNFTLGPIFTVAMIGFAAGYILYYTSNVMHHYHVGQHVAASLALFSSVALLFWYVIQLVMSLQRE